MKGDDMKFVTVSELRQRATQIVSEIESTREEVTVTKNGKPVVLMRFISEDEFMLKETEKEVKKHGKKNARAL
jgi:PHD/YefM family antitoxin component YafN of YafNO toxin-antitoxin module